MKRQELPHQCHLELRKLLSPAMFSHAARIVVVFICVHVVNMKKKTEGH